MLSFARIFIAAIISGCSVAALWWVLGRLGILAGIPGVAELTPWHVGVAVGCLSGLQECVRACFERRKTWLNRELAEELSCSFADSVRAAEIKLFPCSVIFHQDDPSGSQRMTGTYKGRTIDVFDFRYSITSSGSGEAPSSSFFTQTVYRFPNVATEATRFLLRPQHGLSGFFSRLMGQTEVDLSSADVNDDDVQSAYAAFRRTYQITVADPAGPADLQHWFGPANVIWLARHTGWFIEVAGEEMTAWKSNLIAAGTQRLSALEELDEFLGQVASPLEVPDQAAGTTLEFKEYQRATGLAGFFGLWLGVMLGLAVGGMLGTLLLNLALGAIPQNMPTALIAILVVAGCAIVFAVAGGYAGYRLGCQSTWGARLAATIDPRPVPDEGRRP